MVTERTLRNRACHHSQLPEMVDRIAASCCSGWRSRHPAGVHTPGARCPNARRERCPAQATGMHETAHDERHGFHDLMFACKPEWRDVCSPNAPPARFLGSMVRLKTLKRLARPRGVEPLTPRSVVWCSIQLSYGRLSHAAACAIGGWAATITPRDPPRQVASGRVDPSRRSPQMGPHRRTRQGGNARWPTRRRWRPIRR
jgi:hypothetical protein